MYVCVTCLSTLIWHVFSCCHQCFFSLQIFQSNLPSPPMAARSFFQPSDSLVIHVFKWMMGCVTVLSADADVAPFSFASRIRILKVSNRERMFVFAWLWPWWVVGRGLLEKNKSESDWVSRFKHSARRTHTYSTYTHTPESLQTTI